MALDPGIPNDLKKKVPDATGSQAVRAAVMRNTQNTLPNAMYPQPSPFDSVRGGSTSVPANTIPATPDAVNAGPPTVNLGVRDVIDPSGKAPVQTRMPSALDAGQPLPAGVRQYVSDGYHGTPGSNDVIYEGRGAHGERSFSNNQFARTLTGRGADPTLDVNAALRSKEIGRSVDAQTAAANAAAGAAAIAPKTAGEYNDRLKTIADIRAAGDKHTADILAAQGKAGENINNDPSTKTAEGVRVASIAAGVNSDAARERGNTAAAQQFLEEGNDPSAPNAPGVARAGATAIKQNLANLLASKAHASFDQEQSYNPWNHEGEISDPAAVDPSSFDIFQGATGRYLRGPADSKTGFRKEVALAPSDEATLAPYIAASKRRKALISDKK